LSEAERRKNLRLGLAIPVRVQGFLADGSSWEEFSTTQDVSSGGASFPLTRGVELGQILFLSLALPRRLRQFDLNDAAYRVYTLVRGVRRRAGQSLVGVMFFGKYPPRGFKDRPAARYLLPSDSTAGFLVPQGLREGVPPPANDGSTGRGEPAAPNDETPSSPPEPPPAVPPVPAPSAPDGPLAPVLRGGPDDRRRYSRMSIFLNFTLQQVDEWGAVLQEELTVADNVGRGGARVMTTLPFRVGDVILLQEAGGGFATRAEVRAITHAQPSIERLHLRFLDREAPDRLLRQ
jgi:PilZ domain